MYLWECQAYATGTTVASHRQHEHRIDLSAGLAPLTHNTRIDGPGGVPTDLRALHCKTSIKQGLQRGGATEMEQLKHAGFSTFHAVIFMHKTAILHDHDDA